MSSRCRAEPAENQAQNVILPVAELTTQVNSYPHKVSTVKVKALIEKEQDPVTWNGDM